MTKLDKTANGPLFDGRCAPHEWNAATRLEFPAGIKVFLMHDEHFLFVCAAGKEEDYIVLDLYIENSASGQLHNLHASAQLRERILVDDEWSESGWWNHDGWGGFWVPFAGVTATEEGTHPGFLRGSHREIQVLRSKFSGDAWNMTIGVSAVFDEENRRSGFFYPEGAAVTDESTWTRFSFSEELAREAGHSGSGTSSGSERH